MGTRSRESKKLEKLLTNESTYDIIGQRRDKPHAEPLWFVYVP